MHIVASHQSKHSGRARYFLVLLGALSIFIALLLYATATTSTPQADRFASLWFQSIRGPRLDAVMVMVTMLGDWPLSIALLAILVGVLLWHRRWWQTMHLVCIYLASHASVSLTKVLTNRPRPAFEDVQLVSFSFPSGHTTSAALMAGLYALFLSQGMGRFSSFITYSVACLVALSVAISRVYLSAHWTSDVLAGISVSLIFLTAFAWQLNIHAAINWRFKSGSLSSALLLLIIGYWFLAFSSQAPRYGVATSIGF